MSEEVMISVPEENAETGVDEKTFSIEGLSPEEVTMAKEQGLYKEDESGEDEGDNESSSKGDKSGEEEDEGKAIDEEEDEENLEGSEESESGDSKGGIDKDPDNFDAMDKVFEKNEKKFHTEYTPNQKALYFKYKTRNRKYQEIKKEFEEFKKTAGELKGDENSASKLEEINRLLTDDTDNLTIEALQAILNKKVDEPKVAEDAIKPEIEQAKIASKAEYAEKIGKAQYPNFEKLTELVREVAAKDESGTYQNLIDDAFINDDIDEMMLVERIVNIAKLHPKFDETVNSKKKSKVVDRAVKNSKKKISSASLNSSGGRRTVRESELTCDQIAKLPLSEYEKLSSETRKRALMGIDP